MGLPPIPKVTTPLGRSPTTAATLGKVEPGGLHTPQGVRPIAFAALRPTFWLLGPM
jgi:hypothetical protein